MRGLETVSDKEAFGTALLGHHLTRLALLSSPLALPKLRRAGTRLRRFELLAYRRRKQQEMGWLVKDANPESRPGFTVFYSSRPSLRRDIQVVMVSNQQPGEACP